MFNKTRSVAQKFGAKIAAVPALALVAATSARAELPTEVATAVTAYKADALEAIGMVMAAGVAIWGLKKLASKMGWA